MNDFLGLFGFIGLALAATQSKHKVLSYMIMLLTSIIMFAIPILIAAQGGILTYHGTLSAALGFFGIIVYGVGAMRQAWLTTKDGEEK